MLIKRPGNRIHAFYLHWIQSGTVYSNDFLYSVFFQHNLSERLGSLGLVLESTIRQVAFRKPKISSLLEIWFDVDPAREISGVFLDDSQVGSLAHDVFRSLFRRVAGFHKSG